MWYVINYTINLVGNILPITYFKAEIFLMEFTQPFYIHNFFRRSQRRIRIANMDIIPNERGHSGKYKSRFVDENDRRL